MNIHIAFNVGALMGPRPGSSRPARPDPPGLAAAAATTSCDTSCDFLSATTASLLTLVSPALTSVA